MGASTRSVKRRGYPKGGLKSEEGNSSEKSK